MKKPEPVLVLETVTVTHAGAGKDRIRAVDDVSLTLCQGETLGLVGESGCGKSSLARAVMLLPPPDSGRVIFKGTDLTRLSPERLRPIRPRFQMIFQDSVSALNPRRSIGDAIAMPLTAAGNTRARERRSRALSMMALVGLNPDDYSRRPHEISGGQRQRVQIARALMTRPDLLVCDEAVSSLDVLIQAQLITLIGSMQKDLGLSLLFISHDLGVVKNVSDRIAVMYLGKLCETARSEILFRSPAHPYTAALFSAVPDPFAASPGRNCLTISDDIPSLRSPPPGCRFHTRCPNVRDRCTTGEPAFLEIRPGHAVACHFPLGRGPHSPHG